MHCTRAQSVNHQGPKDPAQRGAGHHTKLGFCTIAWHPVEDHEAVRRILYSVVASSSFWSDQKKHFVVAWPGTNLSWILED